MRSGPLERFIIIVFTRLTNIAQRLAQTGIIKHRPFAQPLEQTVLHLCGGSLGVGKAKNFLRVVFVQQKPRNPIRQNPRLTRTRIGGNPS